MRYDCRSNHLRLNDAPFAALVRSADGGFLDDPAVAERITEALNLADTLARATRVHVIPDRRESDEGLIVCELSSSVVVIQRQRGTVGLYEYPTLERACVAWALAETVTLA